MSSIVNTSKKRSRNGCQSCKKLKIKCDEKKPNCEYCSSTGRSCMYVVKKLKKDLKKKQSSPNVALRNREIPLTYSVNNQLVNTINYLNVNKFEIGLFEFFNKNCLYLFSFGSGSKNTWNGQLPKLFFESSIIRNSVCSFSSLNLLSIMEDVDLPSVMNKGSKPLEYPSAIIKRFGKANYNQDILKNQLFRQLCHYFNNSVKKTNSLITTTQRESSTSLFIDPQIAQELVISNVLIFTFLAIHPHNTISLVNFQTRQDFLSICKGVRSTILWCMPTIIEHDLKLLLGFFKDFETNTSIPTMKQLTFPLLSSFKQDLQNTFNPTNPDSLILQQSLKLLHNAIYNCINYNYPNPIFRWILRSSPSFHQLVYEKNLMALRLLYIYSSLCLMVRFQLFNDSNIWKEYIEWYRDYNLITYHKWNFKSDENLYAVAYIKRYGFKIEKYGELSTFNPDTMINTIL